VEKMTKEQIKQADDFIHYLKTDPECEDIRKIQKKLAKKFKVSEDMILIAAMFSTADIMNHES
jgi:hypothetical protein